MNIKTENWNGYEIRFVEIDDEWWAVLKDICDALGLKTFKTAQRLDPNMLNRVSIPVSDIPEKYNRSRGDNLTRSVLIVNEFGIYEALFSSRKLEARKFRLWTATVMKKLRSAVGLEGYEVMRMTEPEIQSEIDDILDTLFYDEETGKIMRSITVAGGDVEQIELCFAKNANSFMR